MSRFRKLSQTIWHCQYLILWTPKYRYRILTEELGIDVENCIRAFSERSSCEVVELNVQMDHVHLIAMVPPKVSISGTPRSYRQLVSLDSWRESAVFGFSAYIQYPWNQVRLSTEYLLFQRSEHEKITLNPV